MAQEKKKPERQLLDFCYFPKFDESFEYLAQKADPEPWDFSNSSKQNKSILKNYLEFYFRKIKSENKIQYSANNNWACFNTGLYTPNLEFIYALMEKNRNPDKQPYVLKAFCSESDSLLIMRFPGCLPEPADFFSNPENLIFNPSCKIVPQIDHIIEDNIDRFPKHFAGLPQDEVRRRIIGAIDEAQRKVRSNYKIAVPQYYNGKIQLLLPLCLTPGSQNPDLALATHKIASGTYTARTILTLQMAYNNARQIVKPQSNWLKP